ncbi:MAG: DUF3108 domain-containing protein [Methyloceanibacter sp.]
MSMRRYALVFVSILLLTCSLSLGGVFAKETPAAAMRIVAIYRVDLVGLNLGNYRLTTVLKGSGYQIRGEGRFSILAGLIYDWHGTTISSGKVTSSGPEPTMYALNYRDGGESAQLRMSFDAGAVTQVSMVPKEEPDPHDIPITKEQLEGVLDPMTAGFLRAHSDNPKGDLKVCDQTIPVFDGEWRFDLVLAPKRTVRVQKETPTGYSGYAAVCRVTFIPISGYQPDNPDIKLMSQTDAIEVWLVSLPGTLMYVPYRIVLPTVAGYCSVTSTSFKVEKRRRMSLESSSQP